MVFPPVELKTPRFRLVYLQGALNRQLRSMDAVAAYLGLPVQQMRKTDSGKPYVASGAFSFSVSHVGADLLLAFANDPDDEIGVDFEAKDRKMSKALIESLIHRFLPAGERETKGKCAWFQTWTEKEALGKCIGTGLMGLSRTTSAEVGVKFGVEFFQYENFLPEYFISVAVRRR